MTILLINGQEAVLPKDFTVSVKRENPFFTKNGEYTYDMTLRLDNKTNELLYGWIRRVNIKELPPLNRHAVLIADNHIYCDGKEVITGWTEKTVSIQIVSGNSELNYFIGQSLMVRFLNKAPAGHSGGQAANGYMGCIEGDVAAPFTGANVANDPKYAPPSNGSNGLDYCLVPFYDSSTDTYHNQWVHRRNNDTNHTANPTPQLYAADPDNLRACPYLCGIVRRLVTALGYTIGINHIEQEGSPLRYLFFVNTVNTKNYAEMFPGWSVGKLLDEIESLTNCHFLVDNKTRRVDIINKSAYYLNCPTKTLHDVVDEYEAKKEDIYSEHSTSDISYDLPDNEYSRMEALGNDVSFSVEQIEGWSDVKSFILQQMESTHVVAEDSLNDRRRFIKVGSPTLAECALMFEDVQNTGFNNYFGLYTYEELLDYLGALAYPTGVPKMEVFYNLDKATFLSKKGALETNHGGLNDWATPEELYNLRMNEGVSGINAQGVGEVDMLKALTREDPVGSIKLGITPAHFALLPYWITKYDATNNKANNGIYGSYALISMMVIPGDGGSAAENDETSTSFAAAIKNGGSVQDESAVHLYVAFYNGFHATLHGYFPVAYTDSWHAQNLEAFYAGRTGYGGLFNNQFEHSLRLKYLDDYLYGGAYQIDTAHPYTFETYDLNLLEPRAVVLIRNKRFVVKEIEEVLTADGRSGRWKVTAFPISISDGALNYNWVLTTGMWDDHAVWLDSGRWTDEP